eukprot:12925919-Prorocentrum_lima.AAC.1
MVLKQATKSSGSEWRWCSSERQFADGLTKTSARQLLCDRMREGTFRLVFDENFTAAKKKSKEERQANMQEHARWKPNKAEKQTETSAEDAP